MIVAHQSVYFFLYTLVAHRLCPVLDNDCEVGLNCLLLLYCGRTIAKSSSIIFVDIYLKSV